MRRAVAGELFRDFGRQPAIRHIAQTGNARGEGIGDQSVGEKHLADRLTRLILSGEAGADALALFRSQIMELWRAAPANNALASIPPEHRPYVASYRAGAICAVLPQWIDNKRSPDADTMSRMVAGLSRPAK